MTDDGPIVDEVRRYRTEISEKFGDDLRRYGAYVRQRQEQYGDRLVSQITVVPARDARTGRAKPA
jgi:hypothetical protein